MSGDGAGAAGAWQRRAIALVDRLQLQSEHVQTLTQERAALQAALRAAALPAVGAAAFDIPKSTHDWKLAEDETRQPEDLWLYDARVDDAVVLEGRRGRGFLQEFGLLGEAPDFAGAVAALNAIDAAAGPVETPDASVIIPVHGQLAYTLNMLDSLARHASRYRREIIIVDDASPDASSVFLPQLRAVRYLARPRNAGFIASCNAGAALATGRYVVLLNNDTRVAEHWLDALLDGFGLWPQAGLVGSKMHYADGSLQEAGGIIWRDGSAANYGRGDDPNRPQYCYARQVDYVSGCSIAVPAALWRELGGFDAHFAPAYCEDVDLALRIKARGLEIWYQPQSRIVHYEGKTSGTDTGSGAKAYQAVNTKKILQRWQRQLSRHRRRAEAPYFERERDVHRRILVVDASAPTPDQDAGSVQTFLALRVCLELGYKTHFVPQDNFLFQPGYTTALQRLGVDCAYAPYEPDFDAYMQRYGWQFDAVLVYRPSVMEKCLPAIRAYAPQATALFHVADLHFLRMQRMAELYDDEDMRGAAALMQARELALIGQVDCTITHSSLERDLLARAAPGAPTQLWPLMFEHFGTDKAFHERRDICFLGGYRHPPNVDAVRYFVREIFPLLRVAVPGLRFIIAGSHPPEEILELAAADIIVAGMVADLRALFDACLVFVCPLRAGAGVKGKIASALSYGIPIVTTRLGIEGTALLDETHVLLAETPAEFLERVLRLTGDAALWQRLSQNGQAFLRQEFSLQQGVLALGAALDTALAQHLGLAQHPRKWNHLIG